MMATDAPLLELTKISKRYGPSLALDSVDFDLFAGELHVLFLMVRCLRRRSFSRGDSPFHVCSS